MQLADERAKLERQIREIAAEAEQLRKERDRLAVCGRATTPFHFSATPQIIQSPMAILRLPNSSGLGSMQHPAVAKVLPSNKVPMLCLCLRNM